MEHISEQIRDLAIDIELLTPLTGNPRKGNIDAIAASYREFGQVKPIVVTPNGDDGSYTVIAGNHQVEAAKKLGWDKIAAVVMRASEETAVAFALADNRTVELGHTDPELLNELLGGVVEDYTDLWDELGWDEFELAALDEQATRLTSIANEDAGYVPPTIINPDVFNVADSTSGEPAPLTTPSVDNSSGDARIVPTGEVDEKNVAATGSTAIGQSGSSKAVVQYTLVFDNPEQQQYWYTFIRYLRTDPAYDGTTTAERLMSFIEAHTNY